MNLRTLFAIPIAIILLVTLSLAAMIMGQGWTDLERGKVAVEAVERMRLLLTVQTNLRAERVVSNFVLGKPHPLPEPVRRQLDNARRETDAATAALAAWQRAHGPGVADPVIRAPYLATVLGRLGRARTTLDELVARGQSERTLPALAAMMPLMLTVSQPIDEPLDQAGIAVTAADPGLSGLVTENRLSASLRDQVGLIAAVLLPRFDRGEQPTRAELDQVGTLFGRAAYLTRLLVETIEAAGATEPVRAAMADLRPIDLKGILQQMSERPEPHTPDAQDAAAPLLPQMILVPWGMQINVLRTAIVDAMVERVTSSQISRERQFDIVMTAFGLVMIAILESVIALRYRVVGPLARLGLAITRIAAGDRSVALVLQSETREIAEMATAVETLRRAALIADATDLRHRMAARHRLEMLREAMGIAQTVQEPARALERGVASLSQGIDATIAMIAARTAAPPATLGVAANAVRLGLAEMRDSAADLDATFAAAAATEGRPEAEFVAHILAVRAQVDRREIAVRGFVQSSLVALRDAASAAGELPAPALRDLVSDQFAHIEETVAVISSMLATMTRATAIVRDLPLDDTPMAA